MLSYISNLDEVYQFFYLLTRNVYKKKPCTYAINLNLYYYEVIISILDVRHLSFLLHIEVNQPIEQHLFLRFPMVHLV